ncbi:hypothetical protein BGW39_010388 [Mortierella sp. 14UC]|nr:hypothetical protein BGW39_010388 [Mortierella sp. 14UC]
MSISTRTRNYHYRISIFDIPHILDLICDSLNSKEGLLPCLQVSRSWYRLFQPQVLRHVEFVNLKKHQTWTILSSAARIKALTVDISDAGWFLNKNDNTGLAFSACVNLQELHCVDYAYLPKLPNSQPLSAAEASPPQSSYVDQTKNALLLIEANPRLRTLTIQHKEDSYKATHFSEAIFNSLALHKSLSQIHINIPFVSRVFRQKLFCSLPVGLRDFEFCCWGYSGWEEDEHAGFGTPEFNLKFAPTSLPFLERLCLRDSRSRVESHWQDAFFPSSETPARHRQGHVYYDEPEVTDFLKELVLYQPGGSLMTDYCWDAPGGHHSRASSSPALNVLEDYSDAFGQLEKLRFSVKDPLWQECRELEWSLWGVGDLEDWSANPLEVPPRTAEDDIRDRKLEKEKQKKERKHQIAFALQVREIFGRLKDFMRLAALEIEWCACCIIRIMTLEQALQLFYETEFDEDENRGIGYKRSAEYTRTRKGWWGPITKADLSWLGLSWPTQAEQQAQADINQQYSIPFGLPSSSNSDTAYARLPDPFHRRVGRVWEDWMYLVGACPEHWSNANRHWTPDGDWSSAVDEKICGCLGQEDRKGLVFDGYDTLDSDHVVYSRQFEHFCSGMRIEKE